MDGPRGADRAFIGGRSGSGKSFLSRHLLAHYSSKETHPKPWRGFRVIIDPNELYDFPHNRLARRVTDIKPSKQNPVVLYRPSPDQRTAEHWNEAFRELFQMRGRVVTYVDETYALEPLYSLRRLPGGVNYFNAYLTQGRARGKAAILAAQRPVNIPRNVIAQAEYFYMFDLPIEDDRITMSNTMGRYTEDGKDLRDRTSLERYQFAFLGPDLDEPIRARIVG